MNITHRRPWYLFPNLTIRFKLIAFFVAMVSSVAVVMVGLVMLATHTTIEDDYEIIIKNAATSTAAALQTLQERVTTYADIHARKHEIATATAFSDTATLERLLTQDYQSLAKNDPTIATLEVTDDQGIVILRGHNPGRSGDNKDLSINYADFPVCDYRRRETRQSVVSDLKLLKAHMNLPETVEPGNRCFHYPAPRLL